VTLDRQKMSRWVEQVAVLLQAVFRMMEQRLIKTHYIESVPKTGFWEMDSDPFAKYAVS
jgi:hypothetical protein